MRTSQQVTDQVVGACEFTGKPVFEIEATVTWCTRHEQAMFPGMGVCPTWIHANQTLRGWRDEIHEEEAVALDPVIHRPKDTLTRVAEAIHHVPWDSLSTAEQERYLDAAQRLEDAGLLAQKTTTTETAKEMQ